MLADRINADYIAAMKAKNSLRSSTLSFLRAQIKNVMIDERLDAADDARVIAVIKKQVKQRQDSIDQFSKAGRTDLADKESAELAVLQEYLPQEMSETELCRLIDEAAAETGAASMKDMGTLMKAVAAKTAGRADNKVVSQLVRTKLGGA